MKKNWSSYFSLTFFWLLTITLPIQCRCAGPRPPKQFTPPPEGEEDYDSDEEYSDEEYSDDEEEDSEEEDSEEEDSEEEDGKPKYKDEVLEMVRKTVFVTF